MKDHLGSPKCETPSQQELLSFHLLIKTTLLRILRLSLSKRIYSQVVVRSHEPLKIDNSKIFKITKIDTFVFCDKTQDIMTQNILQNGNNNMSKTIS